MRKVAALYDVHGNLPALEAVLAEVEREQPDLIIFGGDLAAGWYPVEVLERVRALPNARFVSGNCEREMIEVFDGARDERYQMTRAAAAKVSREQRDFMAAFEPTVETEIDGLGRVLFCHATPRSDTTILTPLTPDQEVEAELEGAPAVVVYGHIHVQGDRRLTSHRLVNAGSVGMPYGATAACWALLGPDVQLRQTPYDLDRAVPRLSAVRGWDTAAETAEQLRKPPSAEEVLERFEKMRAPA
ncbi:MAG TPA: metallophosphoesterase family protein [Candidatus Dormibacteraeota bacterium]